MAKREKKWKARRYIVTNQYFLVDPNGEKVEVVIASRGFVYRIARLLNEDDGRIEAEKIIKDIRAKNTYRFRDTDTPLTGDGVKGRKTSKKKAKVKK